MTTETICISSESTTNKKQVMLVKTNISVFPIQKTSKEFVYEDLPADLQTKISDLIADIDAYNPI